jgi:hypothetical protein
VRSNRALPLLIPLAGATAIAALVFVSSGRPPAPAAGQSETTASASQIAWTSGSPTTLPSPTAEPGSTALPSPTGSLAPSASARPSASVAPSAAPTAASPCPIFPASNVWNKPVAALPVAANSSQMIAAIGLDAYLHPDFDAVGDGIPYNVVGASTPRYSVAFDYADESDPGPYPIPSSPRIEKGSDRHMLMIDRDACMLYELYAVAKSGSGWSAGSGAVWDLRSNALRPAGWTSADAAGLPILPGLVRYEEVEAGAIYHAIRFTAPHTCGYIYPARHLTAPACSNLPPMGLRVRLKASVDISGFGPQARVVLTALKRYGMILADNGSPWYITGVPDSRWNDDELHAFHQLTGADFEVVDSSGLRNG